MTVENLLFCLDNLTPIRIVSQTETLYHGICKDFKDVVVLKKHITNIMHYPNELIILISFYGEDSTNDTTN